MKLAKLVGLLLTGALALSALGASTAAAAPTDPAAIQVAAAETAEQAAEASEEATEAVEEAAEKAEEPAASPMLLDVAGKDPSHYKRIEGLRLRIQKLKGWIGKLQVTRAFVKTLPHTTVRWREHKPRETKRIREYRARIRVTRDTIRALKEAER